MGDKTYILVTYLQALRHLLCLSTGFFDVFAEPVKTVMIN